MLLPSRHAEKRAEFAQKYLEKLVNSRSVFLPAEDDKGNRDCLRKIPPSRK
jgi:hypothetical protein